MKTKRTVADVVVDYITSTGGKVAVGFVVVLGSIRVMALAIDDHSDVGLGIAAVTALALLAGAGFGVKYLLRSTTKFGSQVRDANTQEKE